MIGFVIQIYNFKPVQTAVSVTFLQLLVYSTGLFWAAFLPRASWVEGNRLASLAPLLSFINPGRFTLKEVCVVTFILESRSHICYSMPLLQ